MATPFSVCYCRILERLHWWCYEFHDVWFFKCLFSCPLSWQLASAAQRQFRIGLWVQRVLRRVGLRVPDTSLLRVGNWLLQHSANSVLECVYSWSTWAEGGYTCLDMSVSTCGVAVDATVPEVALDTSEDVAMSPWHLQPPVRCLCCSRSSRKFDFSGAQCLV